VPQNRIVAYAWWTIADANGNKTANDQMFKAKGKLTSSQTDKARKLAKVLYARTCE
jgi:hypothetical protein